MDRAGSQTHSRSMDPELSFHCMHVSSIKPMLQTHNNSLTLLYIFAKITPSHVALAAVAIISSSP